MMRTLTHLMGAVVGAALLTGCSENGSTSTAPSGSGRGFTEGGAVAALDKRTVTDKGDATIVSATGDITTAVGQFRDLLGGGNPNPNVKGEQPGGRREINWDGVPADSTNNDLFPGDFFNVKSPRGVLFTTDGSAFRISDNGYVDVNPNYAGEFNFFSPKKLFAARGSTITDVRFVVAGSNDPATVTGFGSVFEDVGRAHSTTIEYFDVDGNRLLTVVAPRRSDEKGLSFAGAVFDSRVVARVRITSGDTPIGADANDNVKGAGQKRDIVVMDDFIYGEPRKIN
jgi:hypothetical protein